MRINNNIMAMNTHRQYAVNNSSVSKSTEKLSSGYRINRAGDDAAGLAISEKMRAQIRGLQMASKNSEDAISLVQTAEGALTETHAILQRMRELAVQSASDTNDETVDRGALDAEFAELIKEIDDIAGKTAFNGKNLLDGTFGSTINVTAAAFATGGALGVSSISLEGFSAGGTIAFTQPGGAGTAYTASYDGVAISGIAIHGAGPQSLSLDFGQGRTVAIEFGAGLAANGLAAQNLTFTVTGTAAQIQTGANEGDYLEISISSMTSSDLSVSASSIATRGDAESAVSEVNAAINSVSTQRASLGALQNRLEHKISNLDTSAENLQAAESRIRDLDMAKEMTTFTQNSILVQAATAMLAQANAAPQNVLSLLG